jgi:2-aminoadipate transaminase
MPPAFARRMHSVHRSFIREILKVTGDPSIISFAGGLPNPSFFPLREVERAAVEVISRMGKQALQYSTTEGDPSLRAIIAARYAKRGIEIVPEEILITTGSQQGLDLVAKVFLDEGDRVLIERPGYLGSIQAFSFFGPTFKTVGLEEDGPSLSELEEVLSEGPVKFFYAVPTFQNPSGRTYSRIKRREVAKILARTKTLFVEDDPYGELRFKGEDIQPLFTQLRGEALLLGSFSKITAPGFRVGWIVAPEAIREKLVIAKQAADLHTSTLAQMVLGQYLATNDIETHIAAIREQYGKQSDAMVQAIREHFPEEVHFTRPDGGMFLWATLPEGCSSMELFEMAIRCKVAFVPGQPFYVDGSGANSLRLNFSNSDEAQIEEGIQRLGRCIREYLIDRATNSHKGGI